MFSSNAFHSVQWKSVFKNYTILIVTSDNAYPLNLHPPLHICTLEGMLPSLLKWRAVLLLNTQEKNLDLLNLSMITDWKENKFFYCAVSYFWPFDKVLPGPIRAHSRLHRNETCKYVCLCLTQRHFNVIHIWSINIYIHKWNKYLVTSIHSKMDLKFKKARCVHFSATHYQKCMWDLHWHRKRWHVTSILHDTLQKNKHTITSFFFRLTYTIYITIIYKSCQFLCSWS